MPLLSAQVVGESMASSGRSWSVSGRGAWRLHPYKRWRAERPGQNKARVTPATLAHRLGTLRMFSSASTTVSAPGRSVSR